MTIDKQKANPYLYNKDFDPKNNEHFGLWLEMRPLHLTECEWLYQLGRLTLLLQSASVQTEYDRSMIMLSWKSENGLID